MAPRGRPKRDKRMDAAVETMVREYGIPDVELVEKVATKLLDVYGGGNDAWSFVEKYTYLELFEAIVRENDEQGNSAGGGDSVKCGAAENNAQKDAAGHPSVDSEPVREEVENGLEKDTKDTKHLTPTERDGKRWKDIGMDESSSQREICDAVCGEHSGPNKDPSISSMLSCAQLIPTTPMTTNMQSRHDTSSLLSPPSSIPSPATPNSAPHPRRLPCYGWIESDEEDVDDVIDLRPAKQATTAVSLECKCCGMDRKTKRRSRWDLRPDDP